MKLFITLYGLLAVSLIVYLITGDPMYIQMASLPGVFVFIAGAFFTVRDNLQAALALHKAESNA